MTTAAGRSDSTAIVGAPIRGHEAAPAGDVMHVADRSGTLLDMLLTLRCPVLFFLVCLGSGCASLVVGGATRGGYTVSQHDAAITALIEKRLLADRRVNASAIRVSTYQGTVTLYGRVASARARQAAIDVSRGVQGVRRVVSKLSLR